MEIKDWILLLLPIMCNGIFIFLFQKILTTKLEHQNKRKNLRDEVYIKFWNKLQGLNDTFIQINIASQQNPEIISNSLAIIQKVVFDIIQFYDTNKYDLEDVSQNYDIFLKSWCDFETTYKKCIGIQLTSTLQFQLGNALQLVKEKNLELIQTVRRKY